MSTFSSKEESSIVSRTLDVNPYFMIPDDNEDFVCNFIDSWMTCENPIFIPIENTVVETVRRNTTANIFELAILLSHKIRVKTMDEYQKACQTITQKFPTYQSQNLATLISTIPKIRFDGMEKRNGCEPWQAFLVVANFAYRKQLNSHTPPSYPNDKSQNQTNPIFISASDMITFCRNVQNTALSCAFECLKRRIRQEPQWAETNMSMEIAIQMIIVIPSNNTEAIIQGKQFLSQVIQRYSNSYDNLQKANAILKYAIQMQGPIEGAFWIPNNSNILQLALRSVTQRILELFQRRRAVGLRAEAGQVEQTSRSFHVYHPHTPPLFSSTHHVSPLTSTTTTFSDLPAHISEKIMVHSEDGFYKSRTPIHFNLP